MHTELMLLTYCEYSHVGCTSLSELIGNHTVVPSLIIIHNADYGEGISITASYSPIII